MYMRQLNINDIKHSFIYYNLNYATLLVNNE